jgi:uncharacterized membrane protein YdbT with pleckstrin-like domain
MKYIDRVLGPNEQIIHETGLHWIVLAPPLAGLAIASFALTQVLTQPASTNAVILFFMFVLLCILGLCKALIAWATTEIAVTTRRIVFKRGLMARDTIEINFDRIEGLDISQSVLGRILNFGTVVVRGTGIGAQPMRKVSAPLDLRSAAFGDS